MEIDGIEIGPGADLEGKNLANQDLRDLNLSGANLKGANLSGSNLSRANLTGVVLDGAFLTGAKLREAIVEGLSAVETSFRQADFYGANINASYGRFARADFTDANFTGARLTGHLDGINFSNANFEYTSFGDLWPQDCRFWNSDLSGMTIKNCVIMNEDDDGNFREFSIAGNISLNGLTISNSICRHLAIQPDGFAEEVAWELGVFDSDLSFSLFEALQDLKLIPWILGRFENVNLSNSRLGGKWVNSEFINCDFSGTKFSGNWREARFFDCKFDQASFNADLKGSVFEGPGLEQIDFKDSTFRDDNSKAPVSPKVELVEDTKPNLGPEETLNQLRNEWRKWWLGHFVIRKGPADGMLATQNLPQFVNRVEILFKKAFNLEMSSEGEPSEVIAEEAANLAISYLNGDRARGILDDLAKTFVGQSISRNYLDAIRENREDPLGGHGIPFLDASFSRKYLDEMRENIEYFDEGFRIPDAIQALKEDILWLQAEFARERSENS